MTKPRSAPVGQEVDQVARQLSQFVEPVKVYLYNHRTDLEGKTTSFKLCIVAPVDDKIAAERSIYLNIDCDVPFDILIYTPGEWEQLLLESASFASKIAKTGIVLYG